MFCKITKAHLKRVLSDEEVQGQTDIGPLVKVSNRLEKPPLKSVLSQFLGLRLAQRCRTQPWSAAKHSSVRGTHCLIMMQCLPVHVCVSCC